MTYVHCIKCTTLITVEWWRLLLLVQLLIILPKRSSSMQNFNLAYIIQGRNTHNHNLIKIAYNNRLTTEKYIGHRNYWRFTNNSSSVNLSEVQLSLSHYRDIPERNQVPSANMIDLFSVTKLEHVRLSWWMITVNFTPEGVLGIRSAWQGVYQSRPINPLRNPGLTSTSV